MHVVVNGANRGIGLEFCKQAKLKGHRVTALCRKPSPELLELGVEIVHDVEVKSPPDLSHLVAIDWLILNAGIWADESLDDFKFDSILEQFAVNSLGPFRIFQSLRHALAEGAKIGVLTSLMGSMASNTSGGRYGYRASKAALNSMTLSLAHDLKPHGIAVGLFHPGYVATDMTKHKGTITPAESVEGLYRLMQQLDLETSGTWWNYRAEIIPW